MFYGGCHSNAGSYSRALHSHFMHHRTLLITAFCSLATVFSVPAQLVPRPPAAPTPQPAPPPKPIKEEEALKTLALLLEMSKTLDEQKFGHNAKIIKELREAGMSGEKSFALWLDCMKDVEFDQKGKNATDFSEWKRRQTKDPNRERDGELQMQVQWLSIVLMDANARTEIARNEAVTAAVLFVDNLVGRIQKADGRMGGAAAENVLTSPFARHYKLDASVTKKEGGAYVPGDVDSIYEKMILPFYRDAKQSTNLMQAWAKRIEQQTAIAGSFKFVEAREKFTAEKLPELRWGQARELFTLGQEEPATQTMVSLLGANMGHRLAHVWIEELQVLLKKEEAPPAPAVPAPAVSPATPPVAEEPEKPEIPQTDPDAPKPPAIPGARPSGGGRPR